MLEFWRHKKSIHQLLSPLSLVYQCGLQLDKYRKQNSVYVAPVPVVSVGNLVVGGTGKTPVVGALARYFAGQDIPVAVLSRGYGVKTPVPVKVLPDMQVHQTGDEPLMLARQFAADDVQVWAAQQRRDAAVQAIAEGARLLLLDDGMQHWSMARDVDICVFDAGYGAGNGMLLPAGPLREPLTALARADIVVSQKPLELPDVKAFMCMQPRLNQADVEALAGRKVVAFSGIGRPEKFFNALRQAGLNVVATIPFADHHIFTPREQGQLKEQMVQHDAVLVTTAKDAVRLPPDFAHVVQQVFTDEDVNKLGAQVVAQLREKGKI